MTKIRSKYEGVQRKYKYKYKILIFKRISIVVEDFHFIFIIEFLFSRPKFNISPIYEDILTIYLELKT